MKKFLFCVVLFLWVGLITAIYTLGGTNSWPFHNESLITYTTSGMTNEQASNLYNYCVKSFVDSSGNYKYTIPTFVPTSDSSLLVLDNGNNTYTEEFLIPDYQQYGLNIKSRGQSEGMQLLFCFIGGILLVVGGFYGIQSLFWYAYDMQQFDDVYHKNNSQE